MKLRKCFKHALEMVLHSKLRSWLTILGIVIGVASVIAIMSMSDGMKQSMNSSLGNLGGDIVTVTPGFSRGGNMFGPPDGGGRSFGSSGATSEEVVLTRTDLQALKGMPEILMIDTEISGNVKVSYGGKSGTVSVVGVDQAVWSKITTSTIKSGRMLDSADQNVVVVGGRLASSYFSQPIGINKMITIGGNSFRVVGILDDERNTIYMPIQSAYNVIDDKTINTFDSLVIKVKDEDALNTTLEKIETKLKMVRHVTDKTKDFSVSSNKQMQATMSSAMNTMSLFLLAIAGISLLVGAIGVANTMFTSVLEKTKEIGIMKAIGARNRDILMIFLMNSSLIGFVGGLFGIMLGTVLSGTLLTALGSSPLTRGGTFVSVSSIVLSLSVSVIVGVIAGLIPAYQASKLKPVDALRYE